MQGERFSNEKSCKRHHFSRHTHICSTETFLTAHKEIFLASIKTVPESVEVFATVLQVYCGSTIRFQREVNGESVWVISVEQVDSSKVKSEAGICHEWLLSEWGVFVLKAPLSSSPVRPLIESSHVDWQEVGWGELHRGMQDSR